MHYFINNKVFFNEILYDTSYFTKLQNKGKGKCINKEVRTPTLIILNNIFIYYIL